MGAITERWIDLEVGDLREFDAGTIDALASLHLLAGRHGRRVRLLNASEDLLELVHLCGLDAILSVSTGSRLKAGRESE
jgi:ABC-type transporter Mla MlaB component